MAHRSEMQHENLDNKHRPEGNAYSREGMRTIVKQQMASLAGIGALSLSCCRVRPSARTLQPQNHEGGDDLMYETVGRGTALPIRQGARVQERNGISAIRRDRMTIQ